MAPRKSSSDTWRTRLIKLSSAILTSIEDRLEKFGDQEKAQRLRRLQHRLFGPTEPQRVYINEPIKAEEAMRILAQAEEQANKDIAKLRSLPAVYDAAGLNRRKENLDYCNGLLATIAKGFQSVEETGILRNGFGIGVLEPEVAAADPAAAVKGHERPRDLEDASATVHQDVSVAQNTGATGS